jgi:hypothetical protein
MNKIGIVLSALVISMFMLGTVAAMNPIPPIPQEEYFIEKSSAQGTGYVHVDKIVLDKNLAIDVEESMTGFTGWNGSFSMMTEEKLNESANRSANADIGDCHTLNYYATRMLQFEASGGISLADESTFLGLKGSARYETPSFHGGTGALVEEDFNVLTLQKDDTIGIKTNSRDLTAAERAAGDQSFRNTLYFDTMNDFNGQWGTHSVWRKPCEKHIEHNQNFLGLFQVQKALTFEEEVNCTKDKGGC